MIRASSALRPSASPARRARGPRKWRTSISRPARKSRNASPIVDTNRTAWSGFTRSSTAGPSTIPATISSTGPGTGTRGTAARINGTAAATARTATRLSKFIAATIRSQSGNASGYSYPPTQVPCPVDHRWCPPPSCPSCWPPSVCERAQRIRRADLIAGA